jgi:hypothetical protein
MSEYNDVLGSGATVSEAKSSRSRDDEVSGSPEHRLPPLGGPCEVRTKITLYHQQAQATLARTSDHLARWSRSTVLGRRRFVVHCRNGCAQSRE